MNRYRCRIFIILPAVLTLSACGAGNDSEGGEDVVPYQQMASSVPDHVYRTQQLNDIDLTLDAEVSFDANTGPAEIELVPDIENTDALIRVLLGEEGSDAALGVGDIGQQEWTITKGDSVSSELSIYSDGQFYFLDIEHDQNRPFLETEHLFEYGYITNLRIDNIEKDASEILSDTAELFSSYSCFRWQPWFAMAAGDYESGKLSGYYNIFLQAVFEDIPISVNADASSSGVSIRCAYSADGYITVHGVILKEAGRSAVASCVTFDSILDRFEGDLPGFTSDEAIVVSNIGLEYFFVESQETAAYSLVPVWTFTCVPGGEPASSFQLMYKVEDGTFWNLF